MKKMADAALQNRLYAPFLSENVLGSVRIGLGLSLLVLVCWWPGHAFLNFKFSRGTPLIFPAFFLFSLIFWAHHLMAFARQEYQTLTQPGPRTRQIRYTIDIIWALLRHTFLVHLIMVPFYLVVATTAGLSLKIWLASLLIIMLAAVAASMFGLVSLILCGPLSLWGFFLSRSLFVAFFTITGWIAPVLNPVYLIFHLFRQYQYQAHAHALEESIITHSFFVSLLAVAFAVTGHILFTQRGRIPE